MFFRRIREGLRFDVTTASGERVTVLVQVYNRGAGKGRAWRVGVHADDSATIEVGRDGPEGRTGEDDENPPIGPAAALPARLGGRGGDETSDVPDSPADRVAGRIGDEAGYRPTPRLAPMLRRADRG